MYLCIINNAIIHNLKFKAMSDQIAVHENANSTKVIRFIDAETFPEAAELQDKGALHGVYQNEAGHLVAADIWGDEHIAE